MKIFKLEIVFCLTSGRFQSTKSDSRKHKSSLLRLCGTLDCKWKIEYLFVAVLVEAAFSAITCSANIYVVVRTHKRSEQSALHAANPLQSSQCRYILYLAPYLPQCNLSWHSMHTYLIYSTASLIAENVFLHRITERINRNREFELCEKSYIVYHLQTGLLFWYLV